MQSEIHRVREGIPPKKLQHVWERSRMIWLKILCLPQTYFSKNMSLSLTHSILTSLPILLTVSLSLFLNISAI